jgi:hypothetical protein
MKTKIRAALTILVKLAPVLGLVTIFFMIQMEGMAQHEYAHYIIQKNHGCLNGSIDFTWKGGYLIGNTYCHEHIANRSEALVLQELRLHAENEIFAYNLERFYYVLEAGILFIWLALDAIFHAIIKQRVVNNRKI